MQSQNVIREKLRKTLLYKKRAHKMLMKLIPGPQIFKIANTTNVNNEGYL